MAEQANKAVQGAPRAAGAGVRRGVLLGQVHLAAKRLGLSADDRHAVQQAVVGVASCAAMSEAQLARVVQHLNKLGSGVVARAPDGGRLPGVATRWQLATLERAALDMGWTQGLSDARLVAFVRRTTGVDNPAWLGRAQASAALSGLARWAAQRARRGSDGLARAAGQEVAA